MGSTEAISMKRLRQQRRKDSRCGECGEQSSNTYLCNECNERRADQKLQRKLYRLSKNLCVRCGNHPSIKDNERNLCYGCNSVYPNLPIRRLRKWKVKNYELYHAMMEKSCSTKQLADYIGISDRTVCRWVFDNVVPKDDNAWKAARYFNVNVTDLFKGFGLK
ncbi:helix-turn-helix transcriptional regulator [Paenibacillus gallinarum]|uniref:Helix-turn-helix transcriptional regulator n=1 Tax=Paenibacillus gallinarum TaxID=2762232 RepID=A0ABR8T3K5_9BACL|nr:helix-turn-helix transcriptional regulator [Paenibacillus gallinarum]MBD7970337.1 helix-turn-helix transcriptional regulator [Paenibacillus gallinarum]